MLPLLLCDAQVYIYDGIEEMKKDIKEVFDRRINLKENEFITKFVIDKKYIDMLYFHIKKTKSDKIDYPLITTTAIIDNNYLKIAFSGLCSFPFRSLEIENVLNDSKLNREEKINQVIEKLPEKAMDNIDGSKNYREFVLKNTINKILDKFGL